jgi:hypothetical protein
MKMWRVFTHESAEVPEDEVVPVLLVAEVHELQVNAEDRRRLQQDTSQVLEPVCFLRLLLL